MKKKNKGLQDELDYCLKKIEESHPSPHWKIRSEEIKKQLKTKRKKK